jgi:ABC-2 type transport system ATP-binding protein
MSLLVTHNLTKEFQPRKGAINVNLQVQPGEIVGFLGPNGAGKTTTLRMIMGLLTPDSGNVELFGSSITAVAQMADVYTQIGFLPSEDAYYHELTPMQMFKYATSLRDNPKAALVYAQTLASQLVLDLYKPIGKLSLGNRRKVGIILSLLSNPELIILDEPTSGLDPLMQRQVLEILRKHASAGAGILFSSHNLAEVESICDRVVVIKDAELIFTGTISEIKSKRQKKIEFVATESQLGQLTAELASSEIQMVNQCYQIYTDQPVQVVKLIIAAGITDFTVTDPTLEEMFIGYYA